MWPWPSQSRRRETDSASSFGGRGGESGSHAFAATVTGNGAFDATGMLRTERWSLSLATPPKNAPQSKAGGNDHFVAVANNSVASRTTTKRSDKTQQSFTLGPSRAQKRNCKLGSDRYENTRCSQRPKNGHQHLPNPTISGWQGRDGSRFKGGVLVPRSPTVISAD